MTNFNVMTVLPEIVVLVMGCVALLLGVFIGERWKNITYYLVQVTLVIAAILTFGHWYAPPTVTFAGNFVEDQLSVLLKVFIYITAFFSFIYSRYYVQARGMARQEYYLLGLFSVLGMMVLVSANSLLTLFLGLELMSLPIYAMVALERESARRTEAAMKYFIISSMATGMLLYGFSLLYGATKSIELPLIMQIVGQFSTQHQLILGFALVFIVLGFGFKLGAAPFHMWVPDVYEGAPSSVTLFLSAAPKIAALGLAVRLLVDGVPGLVQQWQPLLIILALVSMAWGNLAAIAQSSIKRMLAYSSIAHVGYTLLGLLAGTKMGYGSAIFYMISYALMTLAAFGLLCVMSKSGVEIETIDDFKGLNNRNPWLAFMMLIIMFSMAGVPPFVGFMAKVGVFEAVINVQLTWLAVLALLFSIIGAYYYLRVVKVMYFESAIDANPFTYRWDSQLAISINGLAVLLLGVFPGMLFALCHQVF